MARTTKRLTKSGPKKQKFDPRSVLKPVKSSNIEKMGWHNNIIYVLFKGDKLYAFNGFDLETFGAIIKAESVGKALHALGVKGTLLNA